MKDTTYAEKLAIVEQSGILIEQGLTVPEAARKLGVNQQTLYRWRHRYNECAVETSEEIAKVKGAIEMFKDGKDWDDVFEYTGWKHRQVHMKAKSYDLSDELKAVVPKKKMTYNAHMNKEVDVDSFAMWQLINRTIRGLAHV
jgi:DNA-binding XRE family transcriptional regulator